MKKLKRILIDGFLYIIDKVFNKVFYMLITTIVLFTVAIYIAIVFPKMCFGLLLACIIYMIYEDIIHTKIDK